MFYNLIRLQKICIKKCIMELLFFYTTIVFLYTSVVRSMVHIWKTTYSREALRCSEQLCFMPSPKSFT